MSGGPFRASNLSCNFTWTGQEPFRTTFFRLRRLPGALQEPFKRLSLHLQRRCRDSEPVLVPFWYPLGLKQSRNSSRRPQMFVVSPFGDRVANRLRGPVWDLPGLPFGTLLALKMADNCLEFVLERPRAVQVHLFSAPEASKGVPRGLQEHSKRPVRAQETPRCVREPSREQFGPPRGPQNLPNRAQIWTPPGTPEPPKSSPIEQTRAESSSTLSAVAGTAGRQLDS